MKPRHAFTLIELLIVIAIIAILALIAVPNFLEAQTRAKVSRCMADMRTVVVAIEAYSVDWGRMPPGNLELKRLGLADDFDKKTRAYVAMTTPVGYITSIPRDPFAEHGVRRGGNQSAQGLYEKEPYFVYRVCMASWTTATGATPTNEHYSAAAKGLMWWLHSAGPSMVWEAPWPQRIVHEWPTNGPQNIYDPSNGTVSRGQIIRTNLGPLEDVM